MKIHVEMVGDKAFLEQIHIEPEVIFNRPDKLGKDFCLLKIEKESNQRYLFAELNGCEIDMGCYLMPISRQEVHAVDRYLFRKFKGVTEINWKCIPSREGVWRNTYQKIIELPQSPEEIQNRISSKNRYNLRREQRQIQENVGAFRYEIFEKQIPDEIVKQYFEMKKVTHGCDYGMEPQQYIAQYCVSTAYVMRTDHEILAILFSCEQCETVYLENFTYNSKYKQYSLGSIIYDYFLEQLVRKGKKMLFLGAGNYEYKKKYGSKEIHAYVCKVYRSKIKNIWLQGKRKWCYYMKKMKGRFARGFNA